MTWNTHNALSCYKKNMLHKQSPTISFLPLPPKKPTQNKPKQQQQQQQMIYF